MSLCCIVGYKWVAVIDDIKVEFNDIISLYSTNDSYRRRFVSPGYFILLLLIINTVAGKLN